MSDVALSIVAPVFEERAVLEELARRCVAAGEQTGLPFEVILVDDGSRDGSPELLRTLEPPVRPLILPANRGQFGAIQAGLAAARGGWIAVLDGDLQDPPEVIPELVDRRSDDVDVIFAVKRSRRDPAWFLAGRAVYVALLRVLGTPDAPHGTGTYCLMRRSLAERVGRVTIRRPNLGPLLVVLGARHAVVPYDKQERYDGQSRIGAVGLVREGVETLAMTGALARGAALLGVALLGTAILSAHRLPIAMMGVGALAAGAALRRWSRDRLGGAQEPR